MFCLYLNPLSAFQVQLSICTSPFFPCVHALVVRIVALFRPPAHAQFVSYSGAAHLGYIGTLVGKLLAQSDHFRDGPGLGPGERERSADCCVTAQRRQRHLCHVLNRRRGSKCQSLRSPSVTALTVSHPDHGLLTTVSLPGLHGYSRKTSRDVLIRMQRLVGFIKAHGPKCHSVTDPECGKMKCKSLDRTHTRCPQAGQGTSLPMPIRPTVLLCSKGSGCRSCNSPKDLREEPAKEKYHRYHISSRIHLGVQVGGLRLV